MKSQIRDTWRGKIRKLPRRILRKGGKGILANERILCDNEEKDEGLLHVRVQGRKENGRKKNRGETAHTKEAMPG